MHHTGTGERVQDGRDAIASRSRGFIGLWWCATNAKQTSRHMARRGRFERPRGVARLWHAHILVVRRSRRRRRRRRRRPAFSFSQNACARFCFGGDVSSSALHTRNMCTRYTNGLCVRVHSPHDACLCGCGVSFIRFPGLRFLLGSFSLYMAIYSVTIKFVDLCTGKIYEFALLIKQSKYTFYTTNTTNYDDKYIRTANVVFCSRKVSFEIV